MVKRLWFSDNEGHETVKAMGCFAWMLPPHGSGKFITSADRDKTEMIGETRFFSSFHLAFCWPMIYIYHKLPRTKNIALLEGMG